MTVGNLKELGFIKLHGLAFKNTINRNPGMSESHINQTRISVAFDWANTPEGRNFWSGLSRFRMDDRPKDRIIMYLKDFNYDSLCEITPVYKNGVLVQRNGLFG